MASVATLSRSYQDYAFDYTGQGLSQQPDSVPVTTADYGQLITAQGYQHQAPNAYVHSPEQTTQAYQQHGMVTVLPSQIPAPETAYVVEQAHMMPISRRVSHAGQIFGSPNDNMQSQIAYQQQHHNHQHSSARKRSHAEYAYDTSYPEMQQMHGPVVSQAMQLPVDIASHALSTHAYGYSSDLSPVQSPTGQSMSHHHHHLPNQPPTSKFHRTGYGEDVYVADDHGPPSVVGQPGMPEPAAKPKGPKLKFTPEDDALLVELKETKNLTWKQIADFFPGRSSGTLQVRYCTKLKAKTMVWTDDMVSKSIFNHDKMRHGLLIHTVYSSTVSVNHWKNTNTTAGELFPEKLATDSPLQPAKKKLTNSTASLSNVARPSLTTSSTRCQGAALMMTTRRVTTGTRTRYRSIHRDTRAQLRSRWRLLSISIRMRALYRTRRR